MSGRGDGTEEAQARTEEGKGERREEEKREQKCKACCPVGVAACVSE
jgi:hypothetical protein